MKTIYTCFCTDIIHEGHMNILREAAKYGRVVVGVLSSSQMMLYNRFPTKTTVERVEMIRAIDLVAEVIVQKTIMYDDVIGELHPDYVIHGDNWNGEWMERIRQNIVSLLEPYGGKLIEVSFTRSPEITRIDRLMEQKLAMPEFRRHRLRRVMELTPIVKTIEVHSGLTGLIAEHTQVVDEKSIAQYDAMWISSLCDSTAKGKPDIELVDMTSRFHTIDEVMEVTTKPIIFDGDTGGLTEHFVYTVRTLERMGVSAVIIEDKIGLKKNSLYGTEAGQTQASVEEFCEKLRAGKNAQLSDDFMIIARVESLILERGMADALSRAFAYRDAGADGIMIHSRQKSPDEILEFCDKFREFDKDTPLVVVPSSYNTVTEDELAVHGVNIVIYANQLLRAAFPAMKKVAQSILKYHRGAEADEDLMPIDEILGLIEQL
ncbi:MAG: phosphoenolpyruvate mutase [Eubacterium sp.]|nr:phosphoenolpyruvate mutase [Eubacterium sp.]